MRWKPVTLNKTVTTAGTAVQVSSTSIQTPEIIFQSASANTGRVYVGDSSVESTPQSSEQGVCLKDAGGAVTFGSIASGQTRSLDLIDFYVDASVNSSVVCITYFVQS